MYRRPCLWSYENNVLSGVAGAAGFLTMRTSCGEYLTLSEMINYEVTFRRNSRARSYYDGLEKMEY